MIKEKSFFAPFSRMDPRIEERQLNFFLFPGFVPPFSLKAKIALVIWRPLVEMKKGRFLVMIPFGYLRGPSKSPQMLHFTLSLDSKSRAFDAFRNGKNSIEAGISWVSLCLRLSKVDMQMEFHLNGGAWFMVVGDVALGHKEAKAEISQSIPETHLEHCLLACCPISNHAIVVTCKLRTQSRLSLFFICSTTAGRNHSKSLIQLEIFECFAPKIWIAFQLQFWSFCCNFQSQKSKRVTMRKNGKCISTLFENYSKCRI